MFYEYTPYCRRHVRLIEDGDAHAPSTSSMMVPMVRAQRPHPALQCSSKTPDLRFRLAFGSKERDLVVSLDA
jgi:hypothetical protein